MKNKRYLIPIIIIAIIIGYFGIRFIAKIEYEDRIDDRIRGLCSEKFHAAINASYPFLLESVNAIQSRSEAVKYIAREAGFDRYVFSIMWKNYQHTQQARWESNILWDLDFFACSNACASLTHSGPAYERESASIYRLMRTGKKLLDIENIVQMDSIIHNADDAQKISQDIISDLDIYRNNSSDINAWRRYHSSEYTRKISYYYELKKRPFSLYNYFFDNPLDKEDI